MHKRINVILDHNSMNRLSGCNTFLKNIIPFLSKHFKLYFIIKEYSKLEIMNDEILKDSYIFFKTIGTVYVSDRQYHVDYSKAITLYPDEYTAYIYGKSTSGYKNIVIGAGGYVWQHKLHPTMSYVLKVHNKGKGFVPELVYDFLKTFDCVIWSLNKMNSNIIREYITKNVIDIGTKSNGINLPHTNTKDGIAIATNGFYAKGAIHAFNILKNCNVPVYYYGNLYEPEKYPHIIFGNYKQHEATEILAKHKLLLHLSKIDCLPNVILEASPNTTCVVADRYEWSKNLPVPIVRTDESLEDIINIYNNIEKYSSNRLDVNQYNKEVYKSWTYAINRILN